ncbi:GRB2-associated-binding protein 1-like isoform X2 [Cololabis saira]|uniref:GRB2-associated-binding protein 1-like isoform X2 n=1 Tax=Cololabis saira TaxID=129043 RepID=UPI002AD1D781|nr:GRB2-associated-binding protein 1-like isoform X2 [Cololabis saira]
MSGAGDVICEGWLRKSPPEKKLRRYAWKRRWFVLRSGRLSGEPDVLEYYKNPQSRRPIRTINLNLCEQVDAGLSFTKKELESSFVFDLKTEERTWYLVAESEEDMNRWVTSICLLCGFNPTDDGPERPSNSRSASITSVTSAGGTSSVSVVTGSVPPPYDAVSVQHLGHDYGTEDDYLWLSNCQSHISSRLPSDSSTSLETDYNDNPYPLPSATSSSSSSSSSPSLPANSLHSASSSGFKTAHWTLTAMTSPLSHSLDASMTPDSQKRSGRPRCHPSPHPRKHSLDFHLRPVAILLSDDAHSSMHPGVPSYTTSGYQVPRPASTPQPLPYRRSSTPSVDSLTQAELHTVIPAPPPPRPPKPPATAAHGEFPTLGTVPATLPRTNSGPLLDGGGYPSRSNTALTLGRMQTSCESIFIPTSLSDRASMFEFSDSFNSYFFNKGMVPLRGVCAEDDDVEENYVPMSAATTEPPVGSKVPPSAPADPSTQVQDCNYVPMTPLAPSLPTHPNQATSELALLGRQVPPPAHMGFRNAPMTPITPLTPPLQRNFMNKTMGSEVEAMPPPIHRNLKPQRKGVSANQTAEKNDAPTGGETPHKIKVKPAPLDITPLPQDWQEVAPPVRSPVTRTFTRDPSTRLSVRPSSAQSSSPSSDSDDQDESYVAMTTSSLSFSAGEPSLRLMLHRASEGGVSSPLLHRAKSEKQVEYLDLDLHTGRSTATRQKRCTADAGSGTSQQGAGGEERARAQRTRVDYVVVDPKKTKALKNTREAWHDGRMSTEKDKS